jgi:hypothetical protein
LGIGEGWLTFECAPQPIQSENQQGAAEQGATRRDRQSAQTFLITDTAETRSSSRPAPAGQVSVTIIVTAA